MGNFNKYKKINTILYQIEIDHNIFLGVKSKNDDIFEIINIIKNNNIIQEKLISAKDISPKCIKYTFTNNIELTIYKDNNNELLYELKYNQITLINKLYKYSPINYFSENIDKIYYNLQNNFY